MKKIFIALTTFIIVLTACNTTQNTQTSDKGFIDDSYYISMQDLNEKLGEDNLVIIDARDNNTYQKGHIEGAINIVWQQLSDVSVNSDEKGFGVVLEPKALEEALQNFGINNDSEIVVYSNGSDGWGEDGRILWTLTLNGIDNVKVLDGTYKLWKSNEYPTSKDEVALEKGNIVLNKSNSNLVIDTEELEQAISTNRAKVIDTREEKEYEGALLYGETKGGHIPTSINVPMTSLFDKDGSVKNKEEIDKIMQDAGITIDDEIITYCTAGIRSAHMLVILKSYGYENVKNYDESYYYWSSVNDVE